WQGLPAVCHSQIAPGELHLIVGRNRRHYKNSTEVGLLCRGRVTTLTIPTHLAQTPAKSGTAHDGSLYFQRLPYMPGMIAVLMSPLRFSMCRSTCCSRDKGASP